ncbi:hypothetical protein RQM65_02830 [Pricia sp. S334]|uniref:Uncharacterized protein n=1 Tax=Pricia mediterranea TaxID=3076079 RepID=A0ABU3L1J2_9FLAO|nr:hypothetical protein [Pricia sp. S334]MDT7827599.1 hypothetical protein [Pricia sp. S334]
MAEIKIRKKRPVWPWILVVLVILAVIAFYILGQNNEEQGEPPKIGQDERMENDTVQQSSLSKNGGFNFIGWA